MRTATFALIAFAVGCGSAPMLPLDGGGPSIRDAEPVRDDDAGAEPLDAESPPLDAGAPDAEAPSSCWVSRNVNVNWTLVTITMTGGTVSCTPATGPTSLVTTMRPPCTLGVGSAWGDGTRVNDSSCERLGDTNACEAELLYPAVVEGEALYRLPVLGDTVTVTYENCRATFRAQAVTEGAEW